MRDKPWLLAATALAGALLWTLAATAAARPLIEPPIEIGGAKSLPWGDPASWNAISPAYNPDQLVNDALALLSPEVPIIVRMETLRRATIYSSKDPRVARQLKAQLMSRVRVAEENGKADVLALFDLGYLVEACKQADWLNWSVFDEPNGYALLRRAERTGGTTPEMEFAAALMLAEPAGQIFFIRHLKFAITEATEGSLLAKNLVIHFSDRGKTLAELKAAKVPR
jgi:hypothetical protein